jgi:hypothetical protein
MAYANSAGWRGGAYGVNLQYGVNNPPPSGNLGQSYVTNMPIAQMPIRPFVGTMPGEQTGVPGQPTQRVSGNPDVATNQRYVEKQPYGGSVGAGIPQFGSPRPLNVGQETSWRGGSQFSNDKLITRDRHELKKVGYERSGRNSGFTDPPMDGPARPSYQQINRTISYQQGTDNTINQDDLSRPYARNSQGMYMGTQGDGWTKLNGGTPGLWQPYGSYAGYTNGPVQGIQAPVDQGAPGDGQQSFFAGPPHGLHSPTLPDYTPILGYYMAVPQMRLPRVDRPSNSPIGGQSYSQTIVPQGQTGTIAQQSSGGNLTSAGGGVNWMQIQRNGWRGSAGSGNAQ